MRVCALKEILQELPTASDFALDRIGEELRKGRWSWDETDQYYRGRLHTYVIALLNIKAKTEAADLPPPPEAAHKRIQGLISAISSLSQQLCSIRQYDLDVGSPLEPRANVYSGIGVVQVHAAALDAKGARVLAARLLRAAEQLEEKDTL